ncbi:P-loop containing nucleoside triphosphate hydrolase protein [Whalleya microplaca]|nr:P-loop containing nucleoside triphosphate hydrolase protein [Whalleya microplaca]
MWSQKRIGRPPVHPKPSHYQDADSRSRQLDKFFNKVVEGKWRIGKLQDAQKFLEAITNRTDKPDCIERLASSKSAQNALHKSLTFDNSAGFINTFVSGLLKFFADPSLKRVCDGELLNQIIWVMVDPPLFWNNLIRNVRSRCLESQAMEGVAWLLLQLVLLPPSQSSTFRETAWSLLQDDDLLQSESSLTAKGLFQKVKLLAQPANSDRTSEVIDEFGPGGRHDNDFVNYHDIAVLPTRAEIQSTERPFYRPASAPFEVDITDRALVLLDNQFRLLKEDMLAGLRDDYMNAVKGNRQSSRRNMIVKNLTLEDLDRQAMMNYRPCSLVLKCERDILEMKNKSIEERKKALKKTPAFLRHQSFGCLLKDNALLAFATIHRNEDKLALFPPRLCLQITNSDSLEEVLLALQGGTVDFLQTSTPIFAYEPILERLQRKTDVELEDDLLAYPQTPSLSAIRPTAIIDKLEKPSVVFSDLQQLFQTTKKINLDPSQIKALSAALTYQTYQIQGPPGTGKSLVGALLTKILFDNTEETILVLAYTNHALDQFAEDMLDIGISPDVIVRLGSKSTPRTAPLSLENQTGDPVRETRTRFGLINAQRDKLKSLMDKIDQCFKSYRQERIIPMQILEHLEFSEAETHFFDALSVPEAQEGELRVGRRGKLLEPDELFLRWADGDEAGPFAEEKSTALCDDVWDMKIQDRKAKIQQWRQEITQEKIYSLIKWIVDFNKTQKILQNLRKERTEQVLRSKRIICCTTTAASMYAQEIQAAAPGIIVVEEAGEILESHILAAMGPSTKQLIQIGDHKQLRPKVKNFKLTVEAGRGYDLNRSLFERLILQGRPHSMLLNQHRMRPEISTLIKNNYPSLQDAKGTENRPHLLGFQDDVVFVNHKYLEAQHNVLVDKLDQSAASSKQNIFEAEMVLKCVRYLGQQNYKTSDLVILTPYLGQLSLLRNLLGKDHDPILSDLDSHDLVQAGIMPAASAEVNKRPIRLSTIDNYQGEESDVVVVSLTRSNHDGDIGFMAAPERLNVLISRARNALIMIGNAETFMNAKKGREEWARILGQLKENGKIYGGFPLKCEKHPDTTHIIQSPDEFDIHCPDGGCALPCTEVLSCGTHVCPMRCHIRVDHSKVSCNKVMNDFCPQQHRLVWKCSDKNPPACQNCRREKEEKEMKARRDKDLELERQAKQLAYAKQLRALQDGIAIQRKVIKDRQEEKMKQQTLDQHRIELAQLTERAQKSNDLTVAARNTIQQPESSMTEQAEDQTQHIIHHQETPSSDHPNETTTQSTPTSDTQSGDDAQVTTDENIDFLSSQNPSSAEGDWQHQKDYENASNEALGSLMDMIGLESVKAQFLKIKVMIDTAVRQEADLRTERFGAVLLGNPGTGKTTVARLYARFLSSVGAIPGDHFEESTGSRLAHDGIQGCKALIDQILQKGGGVFFLDEAYQIVSGNSPGGAQVLDFLLAEIENLTGKVVFVFAGYRKQMETFLAHNPGIPSRIPLHFDFQDYEDIELLRILNFQLEKRFTGRMKVDGGTHGLYARIAARRIGRGRGREGFGNAREVQNVLSTLLARQADRLYRERQQGKTPDDFLIRRIDLLGPEPSKALSNNKDWVKLQGMIGLKSVKQSIRALVDRLQTNYEREMKEQPLVECSLNKLFLGNPGTGKTTVAKLYGRILAALGLLSNGEVVLKSPADFVGSVLGQSEKNTKAILDSTKGKVLIIDEAYMLYSGASADSGGSSDLYKTAVVDTIVAEVQSTALEDRCVLLLGYKEQMENMLLKVNPGLSRRFPISSAFLFEDYGDVELRQILDFKLKQQGFRANEATKRVVLDTLRRARNRPNFGNAGEVDIVLDQAKERQQRRLSEFPGSKNMDSLIPRDIDPEFDRGEQGTTNIHMLFKDVIGCEEVVQQLEGYQQVVQNMKAMDMDPCSQIPFGFLFRGPPGTGKTTTARRMGKVYYDMGFLSEAIVVECSATDLVGQYVGHTGPKVQKKFDEALGRVLFIDEAYRLAEGHFAKEAMDEIVGCLTKERYQNKLVVILAGYDNDINRLMNQNPGLTSRFPETISFRNLAPHHCQDLLLQCLEKKRLDTKNLKASPSLDGRLLGLFSTLSRTPSWGNARDVQTLAKSIFSKIMKAKIPSPDRSVSEELVLEVINEMIKERIGRTASINANPFLPPSLPIEHRHASHEPPQISLSTSTSTTTTTDAAHKDEDEAPGKDNRKEMIIFPPANPVISRDASVSDEIWNQLQRDKAAFESRQRELAESRQKAADLELKAREQEEILKRQKDNAARREALLKLEAARVERDLAERARLEKEERMKMEIEVKARLKKLGRCPVGYEWIPQDDGYRCAGGSHFMSNGELGI